MIVTLYKKTISRLLILTACLLLGNLAGAQQYPVQIVPQLLPPYTLNVSDYYNGTNEKLVLLLTNTDLNKPTLQVRLRMSIQGQAAKLISRDNVYYPAISLDGGVPTRITLGDLAPYFNADNLIFEGITRAQYVQSGKLPEGFYQFCFEAVEVNSGQIVGRSSCAMAWISLSDPPLLNLPRKTENIVYKDPQNIIFQWTPRNYNSPTSAFNTEYEFTLVEIWDNGLAPEAAFGSAQPLYRTVTQATTLLYGPGEPLLLSGHKYAWRVRAQQTDGSSGSDAWRNNGYSEIYWFNCQSDCAPPLNVQHELSSGRATITWAANPNQTSFTVDYREKGQNGSTWYNSATTANRMMLYDLKKGKSYEYRVGGTCDNGITYTYSDIKTLEIAAADSAVNTDCGLLVAEENIKNRTPIQTLLTGDVITAGDFPVKLLQVSGQSAFTGAGYVTVPFLGQSRVKVKFSGITVNTDKQLIGGVIETTYDAKESQIKNLDEVIDGGGGVGIVVKGIDTAGYYVDMVIPDARNIDVELNKTVDSAGNSVPGGGATLTITGSDGTTKQVKVEELPATIKDKSGTVYGVDKDGHVSKVASSEPMNMTAAQLNSLQSEKAVVKFLPHENQLYAFDEYQPVYSRSNLFYEEYEKLNGDYYVNSKAIVEAQTDVVKAVVDIKDNSIVADSIRFVTGKGTRYESKKLSNSTWEIKIVGGPAGDAQELYALYPQGDGKFLPLGKLFIAAYPARTFKVVLVPVNGAPVNKDAISTKLNEIYKPVGITFQVTQDKSFDDKSWDIHKDDKLAVSGSGWLSTLTDEMKALNSAYSSARTVQQDAVYLFVLSGSDSSSTLAGDMPRGKQFGYLFTGTDGKVAAHEIGHGLFSLKHVFDNNYGFKQGELPSNVMDYPAGNRFAKHQWDLMYKPGLVIGLFEKDADAQLSQYVKTMSDESAFTLGTGLYYQPASNERTFMSPGGKLVVFKAGSALKNLRFKMCDKDGPQAYPVGCLLEFTLDDVKYGQLLTKKDQVFCHYSSKDKIEKYQTSKADKDLDRFVFNYSGLVKDQQYKALVLLQHPDDFGKVLKSVVPIAYDGAATGMANDSKNGTIYLPAVKNQPEATALNMSLPIPCTGTYELLLKDLRDDVTSWKSPEAIGFVETHTSETNTALRNKIVANIGLYIDLIGSGLYNQLKEGEVNLAKATGGDKAYLDYLDYLKGFWDMLRESGTDAAKVTNPELLVKYYWKKYVQFKSLSEYTRAWLVEDRLTVLNTLVKDNMSGSGNCWAYMLESLGFEIGFGLEEFALSLIENTPENDRAALLDGLLKNSLLMNLIKRIDNRGMGENNFDRLFTLLIEFYKKKLEEKPVTLEQLASQNRVYFWKTEFFTNYPSFQAELLSTGKVLVTTKTVKDQDLLSYIKSIIESKTIPAGGLQKDNLRVEYDPLMPVLLILGEGPSNTIKPLENQMMMVVPAVALDWLWRTNETRGLAQFGKRVVDVGLTVLSLGTWTAATKVGKVMQAASAVFVAGDLLVSESHIKAELLKSVAGQYFLTAYYSLMAITAVADIGTAMAGLQHNADNFVQAYEEVSNLRKTEPALVIIEGSEFDKKTTNLYQTLKNLGYGVTAGRLAQVEQKVSSVIQKLDKFYDKTKITLQTVKEGGVLKLKQLGTYGEFVVLYWDDIKGIFKDEGVFNWANILGIKFNPEVRLEMALEGGSQGAFVFAKTTEKGPLGKAIEKVRAIPDNPQNIREAIGVIRNELNISDNLYNNQFFKSILQKFEAKGAAGVDEARVFMQEIKNFGIEESLAADLSGSRAKNLSELLGENPRDLSIYRDIKADPRSALSRQEERFAGLANKDRWEKWGKSEFFKAVTEDGKLFEDHVIQLVRSNDRTIWTDLRGAITDLKDRKILSQVHFCVPGYKVPCNEAGKYFIADLVFVKYGEDARGNAIIEDMVIGEIKLSDGTPLTDGQEAAKAAIGEKLSVRSVDKTRDVYNTLLPAALEKSAEIKQVKFIEIRGNGNGAYISGGIKK